MSTSSRVLRLSTLALSTLAVVSCSSGPDPAAGCTVTIHPGGDDQMAFQMAFVDAHDHAQICVAPGTYHFTDPLALASLTGVSFRGIGATEADVILDFSTMTSGERAVGFTMMTDVSVSNMTILDSIHDDLYFQHCTGVDVSHVTAGWVQRAMHGAYAIYPVESTNVRVDHCTAFGSADAGLYIGQTTNCIVSNSTAHDNVAGLEIENSTNCEVFGNHTYDNTAGILVFELPGLPNHGMTTSVHDNISEHNNHINFAAGGIVQYVPVGIGVMVMAAREIEVHGNTISNNDFVGVLMVDYQTAALNGAPASTDTTYDGHLRHVYVHDNTQSGNSAMPAMDVGALAGLDGTQEVDVLWDSFVPPDNVPPQICVRTSGHFRSIDGPGGFPIDHIMDAPSAEAAGCTTPVIPPVTLP